ncbi:MAG: hypothetical protein WBN70_16300 [Polyangiales bacterium]|jgi:outer membrane biogenesis lipoprotein LolB
MSRVIVVVAVLVLSFLSACAHDGEPPPSVGPDEGAEKTAGSEQRVTRHKRQIDPDWDSAEEADEQLEGD